MSRLQAGVFPLVTQRRFVGVRVGDHRSPRRGAGDEVAGARPYRPGDRRTWIDWRASARLSAAHGADEFITREFFADTAPRVVLAIDSRPRMGLYDASFPWLDKRAVVAETVRLVAASTAAERGDLAVVAERDRRPLWLSSRTPARALEQLGRCGALSQFGADPGSLDGCLRLLVRHAPSLPAGTFVFVLSDFVDAVTPRTWQRLRALHWDVTPVVIQDPCGSSRSPTSVASCCRLRTSRAAGCETSGSVAAAPASARTGTRLGWRDFSEASGGSGSIPSCSGRASPTR